MKTRVQPLLKLFMVAIFIPMLMASCGKQNKSGGGGSTSSTVTDPWVGTNANGVSNLTLPSDWLNRLYNEYSCQNYYMNNNSNTRVKIPVQSPGQFQVNAGALYVGVTLEGDILIISNNNNNITAEVHACDRPNLTSQAYFLNMPKLNVSDYCAMGEISAADVGLQSQYGTYQLAFFPAGLSSPTSLCQ